MSGVFTARRNRSSQSVAPMYRIPILHQPSTPSLSGVKNFWKSTRGLVRSRADVAGRIRQGRENHVLHDREILERRGIQTEVYDLGRKVLSNFAHFSTLSHQLIMETGGEWEKSWQTFLHPSLYVANFAAETMEAFLETFTRTRQLLSRDEQAVVANFRSTLRTPFEPRIVRN